MTIIGVLSGGCLCNAPVEARVSLQGLLLSGRSGLGMKGSDMLSTLAALWMGVSMLSGGGR